MKIDKIKSVKALALALVMVVMSCLVYAAPAVQANAADTDQFSLALSASANAEDKSLIDVVINLKNVQQELDAVEFELNFDKNLVAGVITENGSAMDAFMTVAPMYTFVTPGSTGVEVQVSRYEQICTYDANEGKYVCRFVDLMAYDYAKPGETYKGLSQEGDLVITIQFQLLSGAQPGTKIPFSLTKVKGTTRVGLNSVSGTGSAVDYSVPADTATPTISLKYPTLLLEDEIIMSVYFEMDQAWDLSKLGLLTWTAKPSVVDISTADAVIPGAALNTNGYYSVNTNAIPAKNLGDNIYFCIYAELEDGSYAYSKQVDYSPSRFAYSQLATSDSAATKSLMVAMLNYGAEAQQFFDYKTDALVNASLTAEQKALVASYSSNMVEGIDPVDSSKTTAYTATGGFNKKYPTVSLEGAFSINYYFDVSYTPDASVMLFYWTEEDYNNATVLNASNASGRVTMSGTGLVSGEVAGIAAKDLDSTIYVVAGYRSGGVSYCTGVLPYSIGAYCVSQVSSGAEQMKPLARAIAVYGYYAKAFFADV